ncbi:MAG: type II/IV secretion system protein [Planctomycetales bacterium]|nr:type II/IV secretion system protein [Planctomycetales bacterium]NIM08445.1 type II/IV secretion system protein [Planctomycetales bacterium]NIN07921.1 type II/IV secretion system protein [Planctomycetales bacterium]NIN77051.1 type II/IV secretion system protein [Planctomycetales bacterium]NIO34236.1 type II/IV secretion system protein [Planctomycetales bacterium]
MSTSMGSFADILLRQGVIGPDQLNEAEAMARESATSVGDALVRLGYATGDDVMRAVAEEHHLDYVNLEEVVIPAAVIELVPESVARENVILPMSDEGEALRVIVSDPLDLDTFDKLRFILNRKIEIALAPRESILQAINQYYGALDGESADSMLQDFTDTAIDFTETEAMEAAAEEEIDETSAPIVRLANLIINEAVQLRASDIHVEPFEDRVRIRYRIDGVLIERDSPPRRLLGALLSRIKIMGKMDIAERRRTQDGRIKVTVGDKELDLRVSMLPTNHGQSCVMRLLDKDNIKIGVRQLGLSETDFQTFYNLIKRPNGIFLVTGPTGSGKTTTLYAALNEMNSPDRKIITAEDPVEYYLPGINQVEVKHAIGLDFARIIRSVLRQAPNIILVGEMRDTETAEMGIQASLTGHLVFSTLHTNDAPSALTRLIDMGVPPYLVASSILAVMAQRLVRVVCTKCKTSIQPSKTVLDAAGITAEMARNATFVKGKGCGNCQNKGFRGRIGIYELMVMSPKLRALAFDNAPSQEVRKQAVNEGMSTLYDDGIRKVLSGITTLDEVYRVAKQVEE